MVFITYNRMLRRLVFQLDEGIKAKTMHKFVYNDYPGKTEGTWVPEIEDFCPNWEMMFAELRKRNITPKTMHVVVDEAQDLPVGFFRYIREFVASTITVFADEEQALSEKRTTLEQIKKAARLEDPKLLDTNHRNTAEIAKLAAHFHDGKLSVLNMPNPPRSGKTPQLLLLNGKEAVRRISNRYRTEGGRIGISVINNQTTGSDFHERLQRLFLGEKKYKNIKFYTSRKRNEDEIDLQVKSSITICNVESIKGQEFDAVFITEFDELLLTRNKTTEMIKTDQRKLYMLCARARDDLFFVYNGDSIPPKLDRLLPGADRLERT